jgi:sensor domain CHASE-containing protein
MDSNTLSAIIGLVVPAILGVVWLVRLEGRINTEKELRVALEARLNGFESRIAGQLDRIERKLDEKQDK